MVHDDLVLASQAMQRESTAACKTGLLTPILSLTSSPRLPLRALSTAADSALNRRPAASGHPRAALPS